MKRPGRVSKKPENKELMKDYETLSASEIGKKYGAAESTVRSWIRQARKELGIK